LFRAADAVRVALRLAREYFGMPRSRGLQDFTPVLN